MVSQSISHYRIIRKLGQGGMGEVFLAEDITLERKVAIKLLPARSIESAEAKRRLVREAKAAATLDHPNICAIYEVNEEDAFIAMQYIDGDTLSKRIKGGPLEVRDVAEIGLQVADALADAHSRGIIHKDIKPHNVMLTSRGQVKVLDFGLAKFIRQENSADTQAHTLSQVTEPGMISGTPAYMSPEQIKDGPVDGRSDLFSLGVMLYECSTGGAPFTGTDTIDTCLKVIQVDPPPPSQLNPHVPPELDRIILKAMSKDVSARYQAAQEMLADLRSLNKTLEQADQTVIQGPALKSTQKSTRPSRSLLTKVSQLTQKRSIKAPLILMMLVVIVAIAAALFIRPARSPEPSPEAKRWYEVATEAIQSGAYYQASKALEQAIALDDKSALIHARLAEAYVEMDYIDKAKDELLIATSLAPDRSSLSPMDALYLDAIGATVRRDFPQAIESYRKIVEQAPGSYKAHAYLDLGRAYEKNEELGKAVESYGEAAGRGPESAAAFLRLGTLYGRQQDLKNAVQSFDRAESIYQRMSNLEGVAEVLYERGALLNNLDRVAEARAQLDKALELATLTDNNKYQRVKILLQLSSLAWGEANSERAKQYATEAIKLAEASDVHNLETMGLIDLGAAYFSRGEYGDAEKYFTQALEQAKRYKVRRSEARACLALANIYIQRDSPDEAISYVEQARDFYQSAGYRKETARALLLLGRAKRQKGDYQGALEIFSQQIRIAEDTGDQSELASSHVSIGYLLGFYLEQYSKALDHFNESIRLCEAIGAKYMNGYNQMNRGRLLAELGRYDEARASLSQALAVATHPEAGSKELLAFVHLANARMALGQERFPAARDESRQALALADKGQKEIAVLAGYTQAIAQARSGSPRPSKIICENAVTLAKASGNPRFAGEALLALAEVLLYNNEPQNALGAALEAQAGFQQSEQQDSDWRASLIAARAYQLIGDYAEMRKYASSANNLLLGLEQKLGAEAYGSFLSRPDVQNCRKQIRLILEAN
jgi:serine/threonine protein kinase/lipopolysaccharide biosynthesis regulator YciM